MLRPTAQEVGCDAENVHANLGTLSVNVEIDVSPRDGGGLINTHLISISHDLSPTHIPFSPRIDLHREILSR